MRRTTGVGAQILRLPELPLHALAVVVELGLQPPEVIEVLRGLSLGGRQVSRDLRGPTLGRVSIGARPGLLIGDRGGTLVRHRREAAAVRDADPRFTRLVSLPVLGHLTLTSIARGLASSRLGTSTVSTPLSKAAWIFAPSAVCGSLTDRANEP